MVQINRKKIPDENTMNSNNLMKKDLENFLNNQETHSIGDFIQHLDSHI